MISSAHSISLCLLIVAALPGALSGCGRSGDEPLIEVRLGYFANATHAQAVLGADSGEFAEAIAPLKLSAKVFNAGPSMIEAIFADEIDIGYIGPGPALSGHARSRGQGIRVISGAAANGVVIVARPGSGIESIADLRNKRIATPQHGNTQDIAARHYVLNVLGQSDAHNVLAVPNAEQGALMSRDQIDAAWAPEPWGARLVAEAGAKVIAEEKDLWPGGQFSLTVVITTPQFLAKHPDVVEKMLRVHRAWTKRLSADPSGQLPRLQEALFRLTNKRLPPGVLEAALPRVTFLDDPLIDTFDTMGQWAYELEFARQPARVDNLFDLAILQRLERADAP